MQMTLFVSLTVFLLAHAHFESALTNERAKSKEPKCLLGFKWTTTTTTQAGDCFHSLRSAPPHAHTHSTSQLSVHRFILRFWQTSASRKTFYFSFKKNTHRERERTHTVEKKDNLMVVVVVILFVRSFQKTNTGQSIRTKKHREKRRCNTEQRASIVVVVRRCLSNWLIQFIHNKRIVRRVSSSTFRCFLRARAKQKKRESGNYNFLSA